MKNSLISLSVVLVFVMPQVSAESLFDKIKRKADEIIAEQEAKADQKIDQTIDETVDSAEQAVYEGNNDGSNTSSGAGAGNSASTKPPAATGDNANAMLVKMTQTELKRLGYSVSVDGVYGSGTRNAILAYETDSGRPLTGNVSPDLVNALKSTPTPGSAGKSPKNNPGSVAAYQSSNATTTAALAGNKAMQLFNECNKRKQGPAAAMFGQCASTCWNAYHAPAESADAMLQVCIGQHKAAFENAEKMVFQNPAPAATYPSQAATNSASTGGYDTPEEYMQQLRKLAAECQAVPGNNHYAKGCASTCAKNADRISNMNPESGIKYGKIRLKQCRDQHKWAMGS